MNIRPGFDADAIHACVSSPGRLTHLRDVRFHLWQRDSSRETLDELLECVSPVDALCQMAAYTDVDSLVIAMDWITCRNPDLRLMSHEELAECIDAIGRFPGVRRCREALSYSVEGTDSPQESALRRAIERYGLPRLEVNYPVFDPQSGKELRVDMALPEYRIAVEYDGRYHYTMDRWEGDLNKRNRLRNLEWSTFVATRRTLATETNLNEFLAMIAKEIGRQKSR